MEGAILRESVGVVDPTNLGISMAPPMYMCCFVLVRVLQSIYVSCRRCARATEHPIK